MDTISNETPESNEPLTPTSASVGSHLLTHMGRWQAISTKRDEAISGFVDPSGGTRDFTRILNRAYSNNCRLLNKFDRLKAEEEQHSR